MNFYLEHSLSTMDRHDPGIIASFKVTKLLMLFGLEQQLDLHCLALFDVI